MENQQHLVSDRNGLFVGKQNFYDIIYHHPHHSKCLIMWGYGIVKVEQLVITIELYTFDKLKKI